MPPIPSWRRSSRRSKAWARWSWAAAPSPPCASSSIRAPSRAFRSGSTRCAPRSANANANSPTGALGAGQTRWQIATTDQLFKAADYGKLIVSYHNGSAVQLSDVATVADSVQDRRNAGLSNGKPAVLIILFRQPAANMIETVDRVRALLPQLEASIPPAIHVGVVIDRTTTIRASVDDVQFTLMLSIALVVMVVFLFLRNGWATLIPGDRRAAFAAGHLRRHVPGGLHARQPLADGAHHLHRLRGGRRHRRHRKHRAPPRAGNAARSRPPCEAPRKSASPCSP